MLIIAGLGNPGSKYAANRHNIGFMAVGEIVRRHNLGQWRKRFHAEISEGLVAGEKLLVMKPQTFMNESGRAVGDAMRFYNLTPDDVVVMHDELDLPASKMRMKQGGGHAGNNGIRSLIAHIGAGFHRVRLGIGHPGDKAQVHKYVLHDFAKADDEWLIPLIDTLAARADLLAKRDFATYQNKVHLDLAPQKSQKPIKSKPTPNSTGRDKKTDNKTDNAFAALKKLLGKDEG